MASPHLFSIGVGGISSSRLSKLNNHEYFKHLMSYYEGRFAKDLIFPYYAFNSVRWDAFNCGNVYVRDHHLAGLNVENLRKMNGSVSNVVKL